jgi:hypothetical protein
MISHLKHPMSKTIVVTIQDNINIVLCIPIVPYNSEFVPCKIQHIVPYFELKVLFLVTLYKINKLYLFYKNNESSTYLAISYLILERDFYLT